VCDLDNEPTISVAQVVVTVDGQERTFDLCDTHLDAFRAAVAPFVPGGAGRGRGRGRGRGAAKSTARAAKKTAAKSTAAKATGRAAKKTVAKATVAKARPGRPAKAARRSSASGASNTAAVRAWAREQGIAVPERGRLGRDLIERYQQATSGSAASA
jgi:hypothetical protein